MEQHKHSSGVDSSMEELRLRLMTYQLLAAESIGKSQAGVLAEKKAQAARARLGMYEIRSPVRGLITRLYKHRGEAVRAYEPVMQVLTASE